MLQNKIIKQYEGPIYKRGEIITVQGRKFKYVKMVKGNWALRSFPGNEPYQLNKAGFLIPC